MTIGYRWWGSLYGSSQCSGPFMPLKTFHLFYILGIITGITAPKGKHSQKAFHPIYSLGIITGITAPKRETLSDKSENIVVTTVSEIATKNCKSKLARH